MKALDWQRSLEAQRREHGKTVFTVTKLANLGQVALHQLNVER